MAELEEEERILTADFSDAGAAAFGQSDSYFGATGVGGGAAAVQEAEYQRKVSSLEGKLKQAHLELQNAQALKKLTEDQLHLV